MKKLVFVLIVLLVALSVAACTLPGDGGKDDLKFDVVYAHAVELGFEGDMDDLVALFKGDSAYALAKAKGYNGTEAQWLLSLVGAKGEDGITPHIDQTSGNWYIGTTNTGVKARGADGKSAYDLAVAQGYGGTAAEWLASLVGEKGDTGIGIDTFEINANNELVIYFTDGTSVNLGAITAKDGDDGEDGKSAFEVWKELHGDQNSTEADFLAWIKGDDGEKGDDGKDGESAFEIFMKYNPEYPADEEQWIEDFVNGRLIKFTVTFKVAGNADIVKRVFCGYSLTDVPEVPEKVGNIGAWDRTDFTNITQNLVVNAVYTSEGLNFTLIRGDTEAKLTGATLLADTHVLVIPEQYNGVPVTTIAANALANKTSLTHVTVPNTVTKIESGAFSGCSGIVELSLPFVGETGDAAINNTLGFIFGAGNSSLPATLKTVNIAGGAIGANAFAYCGKITAITLDEGVTGLGESAFEECNSLISIVLPDSITEIGYKTFYSCDALASVTLGAYVTAVGNYSFGYCYALRTINIPETVTYIDGHAFYSCNAALFENYQNNLYYIDNAVISVSSSGLSALTFKPTTTIIADRAFIYNSSLSVVTLPNGLKYIGADAFSNCSNLVYVYMPASVTSIGAQAFYSCPNLRSVTIGANVADMGTMMFYFSNKATVYTTVDSTPPGWSSNWSSMDGPVIWGCTMQTENGYDYVYSFTKSSSSVTNANAAGGINPPLRLGYTFGGWNTAPDGNGDAYPLTNATTFGNIPDGTVLYAVWVED